MPFPVWLADSDKSGSWIITVPIPLVVASNIVSALPCAALAKKRRATLALPNQRFCFASSESAATLNSGTLGSLRRQS
jgi:hypothetical protein